MTALVARQEKERTPEATAIVSEATAIVSEATAIVSEATAIKGVTDRNNCGLRSNRTSQLEPPIKNLPLNVARASDVKPFLNSKESTENTTQKEALQYIPQATGTIAVSKAEEIDFLENGSRNTPLPAVLQKTGPPAPDPFPNLGEYDLTMRIRHAEDVRANTKFLSVYRDKQERRAFLIGLIQRRAAHQEACRQQQRQDETAQAAERQQEAQDDEQDEQDDADQQDDQQDEQGGAL